MHLTFDKILRHFPILRFFCRLSQIDTAASFCVSLFFAGKMKCTTFFFAIKWSINTVIIAVYSLAQTRCIFFFARDYSHSIFCAPSCWLFIALRVFSFTCPKYSVNFALICFLRFIPFSFIGFILLSSHRLRCCLFYSSLFCLVGCGEWDSSAAYKVCHMHVAWI